MLTEVNAYTTGPYKELCGLSTDTKPTDVGNGSVFEELDTGLTYIFDAEGEAWVEQPEQGGGAEVEPLEVTENGTYTAPDGKAYSPVTVDVPQGGGGVPESDVNFYDYDGTVVAAYTAADFASLAEMPANPDHTADGLTAQGWNWSLADAKAYVADYGMLDVGQMYVTTDGKTRIKIHLEAPRLSPRLNFGVNGTATIEWGDGTTDTITGTNASIQQYKIHTYANGGDYTIAIGVGGNDTLQFNGSLLNAQGSYTGGQNIGYTSTVLRVFAGSRIAFVGDDAFRNCCSLNSITLSNGVTGIGNNAFNQDCALKVVVLPSTVTTIGYSAFQNCYPIESVIIPSGVTSMGADVLNSCYSYERVAIPSGVTSIGVATFRYGYSLKSVVIPSDVASIGSNAFANCSFMSSIKFKPTTPPVLSASNVFSQIPTDCKIYVPTGTLTAYTTATNYPNPSTYTYVEY